jgi:CHAT domain-containing protein
LPEVQSEVTALASLFPDAVVLLDENATIGALQAYAPTADVLHLACHGQSDLITRSSLPCVSPMAGSRLYDAYQLDLRCTMVSLSACETGISMVVPGDELIGLARGFFAAGAPSLLVSLWSADDAATARLMVCSTPGFSPGTDQRLPCGTPSVSSWRNANIRFFGQRLCSLVAGSEQFAMW